MWEFLGEHWAEILLALVTFLSTFTALTETKKDDAILDIAKRVLNAVFWGRAK